MVLDICLLTAVFLMFFFLIRGVLILKIHSLIKKPHNGRKRTEGADIYRLAFIQKIFRCSSEELPYSLLCQYGFIYHCAGGDHIVTFIRTSSQIKRRFILLFHC